MPCRETAMQDAQGMASFAALSGVLTVRDRTSSVPNLSPKGYPPLERVGRR